MVRGDHNHEAFRKNRSRYWVHVGRRDEYLWALAFSHRLKIDEALYQFFKRIDVERIEIRMRNSDRARSWEFFSLPNCAVEVLVHARRHGLVVLVGNVFAYHLRVQEAVTANAAMPLVAGEDVRTPLGAFRVVLRIGHFNNPS